MISRTQGRWVDRRPGREPTIVVTDRAHDTLPVVGRDGPGSPRTFVAACPCP